MDIMDMGTVVGYFEPETVVYDYGVDGIPYQTHKMAVGRGSISVQSNLRICALLRKRPGG